MNTSSRLNNLTIVLLLAVALLAGCASGMDKNQCVSADWRTIGYEDGLRGAPADRIGVHRNACGKFQVTPDLAAYLEGRERGLKDYCQAKNGFRVGVNGGGYANVCTGAAEAAFVTAYRQGRELFDARGALRQAHSQMQRAKSGLSQTDAALTSATVELTQPQATVDRRAFLASELVRLAQERASLITRIDQLGINIQELQENVRVLEQRSAYPL